MNKSDIHQRVEMAEVPFAEVMPQKGLHVGLPELVLTTMHWVELQCQDKNLHGVEKLELFKAKIGAILDHMRQNGFVTAEQDQKLQQYLNGGFDLIEGIVDMYVAISKNPGVVQVEKSIKEGCGLLCAKRARK